MSAREDGSDPDCIGCALGLCMESHGDDVEEEER